MTTWSPDSWRSYPAGQQPEWPDETELKAVLDELRARPPLVFAGEARNLQESLARAARGEAFVLQAGDCAEAFGDISADEIRDKLKIVLQMAVVLTYGAGLPVVKVGRIAGQFAKPRSLANENQNGVALPAFRGHAVNDPAFDENSRRADPRRLLRAYRQSVETLNLIRAFTKGGFADLKRLHVWNQEFVAQSKEGRRYEAIARQIDQALRFMIACGINPDAPVLHEVDFYTSHEALLLGFEEALTRRDSLTGDWYDCSAHLLWVGERTRQPGGAHVEFLSGIHNPIACKLGPSARPEDAITLCKRLDPRRSSGRLTFITRMGAAAIEHTLPPILSAVRDEGWEPVWVCDPMHGNTFVTPAGFKTRDFNDILGEVQGFFSAHKKVGTAPGGVHLELTSDEVTECVGGEVLDTDIHQHALCDPRLNARQSLELAFQIGELLQSS